VLLREDDVLEFFNRRASSLFDIVFAGSLGVVSMDSAPSPPPCLRDDRILQQGIIKKIASFCQPV
jgi:hypothetical protein